VTTSSLVNARPGPGRRLSLTSAGVLLLGFALVAWLPASAATSAGNFVTRSGTQLRLAGQPYRFGGLNIYNANSTGSCWYPMASGNALERSLSVIGSGSNRVLRAWFTQNLATTGGMRDWSAFDHTVHTAAAHGWRVIVALSLQGGDCGTPHSTFKTERWYRSEYRTSIERDAIVPYRQWVQQAVTRYGGDPTILMWQLVSEAEDPVTQGGACSATAAQSMRHFVDDMGALVKGLDPHHLLSLSSIGTGQCGTAASDYAFVHASPYLDLCEYHDYSQATDTVPADLRDRIGQCSAIGKPLFVGESGITAADAGGWQQRANAFNAKLRDQFGAGSVGEVLWNWNLSGSSYSDFDIGPNDPTIPVLMRY
jgi:mannan endo-1,4-beta-mannosidase